MKSDVQTLVARARGITRGATLHIPHPSYGAEEYNALLIRASRRVQELTDIITTLASFVENAVGDAEVPTRVNKDSVRQGMKV